MQLTSDEPAGQGRSRLRYVGEILESKRHAGRVKALKEPVRRSVAQLDDAVDVDAWLRGSPWNAVCVSLAAGDAPYKPVIATDTSGEALAVRLDALDAPEPTSAALPDAVLDWVQASLKVVGAAGGSALYPAAHLDGGHGPIAASVAVRR